MVRPPSQRAVVSAITFAITKLRWIALRADVPLDVRDELLDVTVRLDRLLKQMPRRK